MHRIKVALIGEDHELLSLYKMIRSMNMVEIIGISDLRAHNQNNDNIRLLFDEQLFFKNYRDLISRNDYDILIEITNSNDVKDYIRDNIENGIAVLNNQSVNLMLAVFYEKNELKEEMLELKRIQGELSAILNSMQEAIEVADINGVIKYVNPAFTRITGIPEKDRIGRSIFVVSPEGALANVLKTGKLIFGQRTKISGSSAEVISNSAPIIIDGKMEGGVVVFQHSTNVMKLMEEIKESTSIIEDLTSKLGQAITSKYSFDDILGGSYEIRKCVSLAQKSANSDSTVLLLGESGTGKELFAHAIHGASMRRESPFIKVNCAAIPETLLESEFFGYDKGAFTGALKTKIGKFELAHGGTIFLDEIGDMNLVIQGKLLRVLQEMEFERVGGNHTIKVNIRVIAATNRNLRELIRHGRFREDLFYRLNVVEITIPPLRMHKEDLPVLVSNLINKLNRKLGKKVKGLAKDAEELLAGYDWPGNVRELENVIERVMVTVDDEVLEKKHLIHHIDKVKLFTGQDIDLMPIDRMEEMLIRKAVVKFGNSVEGKRLASQALNISLATLYNKLKKFKVSS